MHNTDVYFFSASHPHDLLPTTSYVYILTCEHSEYFWEWLSSPTLRYPHIPHFVLHKQSIDDWRPANFFTTLLIGLDQRASQISSSTGVPTHTYGFDVI